MADGVIGGLEVMRDAEVQTAFIALGSNLPSSAGGPAETVRAAIEKLRGGVEGLLASCLYGTAPVGYGDQPAFVNAVVRVRTAMAPEELMRWLLQVEREFGRDRAATLPKGPRTLDLDLLLMGEAVLNTPLLTLPHPALAMRRFVLAPLAELAPELLHPTLGKTIAVLLRELPQSGENGPGAVQVLRDRTSPDAGAW